MRVENNILLSDYSNQKYPLDSFDLVGEVEYHDEHPPYNGWTFKIKPIDVVIGIINSNLSGAESYYLIPSGNEQNVRDTYKLIFDYKNGFVLPHEPVQYELTAKGKAFLKLSDMVGTDAAFDILDSQGSLN